MKPARQVEAELLAHGIPVGYILGEEAAIAQCEFCGKEDSIDVGVICEACNAYFCRAICFRNHTGCEVLTTLEGRIVHLGDLLGYPNHGDLFDVIEMQGTWVKGGYARGRRHRGSHEMPIITRLMEHKKGTD